MLKQIRWNKKRKWIDTRYAKPYKARLAIKRMQMAQAYAVCAQLVSTISSAPASGAIQRASKAMSIATHVMNTQRIVIGISDGLSVGKL
jgi:hypothetical protein